MDEPSLLDYLKERLKFWQRGERIRIPDAPAQEEKAIKAFPVEKKKKAADGGLGLVLAVRALPVSSLLALFFALIGQSIFEPRPGTEANARLSGGLFFYGLAALLLALALLRRQWPLAEPQPEGEAVDALKFRWVPLVLCLPLSLTAFLAFSGNLFTPLNLLVWLLAVAAFVAAFWLPQGSLAAAWQRLRDFVRRPSWQLTVTRWTLLVVLVSGLVIFFRVYNINGVPVEPFSDHAEKILDVHDVTRGETRIFFPRNTGREALQMYLTVAVAWLFRTGLSFLSLKIGTVLCGLLTLPYMYLLGKEIGGKRVGLLALLFAGMAYWPNVISRVGLRFPLYPLFVAPVLYYLIRGLRSRRRNDFILAGLFLGLGLHGYSPIRILPIVVVVAVGLYLLHRQSRGYRLQATLWLGVLALTSFTVFLPLARYWTENPDAFGYRAFSRMGTLEAALPGPAGQIFLSNLWNALRMFNWDDGEIWVHSVTHRPALDVVSGALFLIGALLVLVRYIRRQHWLDLFLLLSIPLLQLPSSLSLAFPAENPALNRAGGAMVPVFLLVALALDGLLGRLFDPPAIPEKTEAKRSRLGPALAWVLALFLVSWSAVQNYDLVFNRYASQFKGGAWNSSQMGAVIQQFEATYATTDTVWIVPYPYWVDTRLPGVWAGIPNRDFAVWPDQFAGTQEYSGPKLFIVNIADDPNLQALEALYPSGVVSRFSSGLEGKDFYMFFVPPEN
jgi:hypothetical protein